MPGATSIPFATECDSPVCKDTASRIVMQGNTPMGKYCETHALSTVHALNTKKPI